MSAGVVLNRRRILRRRSISLRLACAAYAPYGGICIAACLMWLWAADGQRPTTADLVGAAIAIIGALVIIGFASHPSRP